MANQELKENKPPKKSSLKSLALVFLLLFILFFLFLFGIIPRWNQKKAIEDGVNHRMIPEVAVVKLKSEHKDIDLVLPSSAEALHITPIWARTNGYLIQYYADIGDRVFEGDLLADIDTPEVDQELDQAIADLHNAIAKMDLAKISKDRWETLYKKNPEAVPKQEVDEKDLDYKAAVASKVSFERNVERLHYIQQFKKIYAPFDGIITQRNVDVGTLITAGSSNGTPQELFQIAETGIIRFFVDVPQTFFRQISNGLETDITIREFQDKVFKGKVVRYAKALDPVARTMRTEIHVPNPEDEILNGLYAEVKFKMRPEKDSFIVPSDALILRTEGTQIATVDNHNKAHIRKVKIGRDFGKTIEIIDGLKENERVIINPTDKIKEGTQVEVLVEKSLEALMI